MKQGDRVKEVSLTMGTGSLTLSGAAPKHLSFSSEIGEGTEAIYLIESVLPSETWWEISRGTLTGSVLTRTLIKSSTGSLISLPEGAKYVSQVLDSATVNEIASLSRLHATALSF